MYCAVHSAFQAFVFNWSGDIQPTKIATLNSRLNVELDFGLENRTNKIDDCEELFKELRIETSFAVLMFS